MAPVGGARGRRAGLDGPLFRAKLYHPFPRATPPAGSGGAHPARWNGTRRCGIRSSLSINHLERRGGKPRFSRKSGVTGRPADSSIRGARGPFKLRERIPLQNRLRFPLLGLSLAVLLLLVLTEGYRIPAPHWHDTLMVVLLNLTMALFLADLALNLAFEPDRRAWVRSRAPDLLLVVPVLYALFNGHAYTGGVLVIIRECLVLYRLAARTRWFQQVLLALQYRPTQQVALKADEEKLQREIIQWYHDKGLFTPTFKETMERFAAYPEIQVKEVIDLQLREGKLVKISESLYYSKQTIEQLIAAVEAFIKKEGEIDAPGFKNLSGLTRKFSIPILEYLDRIKLTIRIGDKRILRKKA